MTCMLSSFSPVLLAAMYCNDFHCLRRAKAHFVLISAEQLKFVSLVCSNALVDSHTQKRGGKWFAVAVAVFAAAVVYLIVVAFSTSDLTDDRDDTTLLILGTAGAFSLAGWWRERARRSAEDEAARHDRARLESELQELDSTLHETGEQLESAREGETEQRRARERAESRLEEREKALSRERYLRSRSEEAHRSEKDWRQELNAEVMRMYREKGSLGDPSDVPSMVLRLSRTLLGAEKGLLLSRQDENGDGKLDLIASEGFEHDPGSSEIVHRFAEKVLERDQAVRETSEEVEGEQRVGADEEIKNLVAIPIYLQDDFGGVVVCANNPEGFEDYDDDVLLSVGDQAGAVLQNAQLQGEQRLTRSVSNMLQFPLREGYSSSM